MHFALIVNVLNRFDLFTRMAYSIDESLRLFVIDNYNHNRGCGAGWNEGMLRAKEAGYKYALISNDDVEFHPGALLSLYKTLKESRAGVVSANPNAVFGSQGVIGGIDFCCFAVDIDQIFHRCGTFDENFHPAYFEDNDMHRRMILAGVECLIDTNAVVTHHGSQTQYFDRNNPVVPPHMFEDNRRYFIEKWGGSPGQETHSTPFGDPNLTIRDWTRR